MTKKIKLKKKNQKLSKQKIAVKKPLKRKPFTQAKKAPSKKEPIKIEIKDLSKIEPVAVKKTFIYTRQILVWSFILVGIFAVLSILASNNRSGDNSSFFKRLPQAATLNGLLNNDEVISVVATGDIMLGRYVETVMRHRKDYNYPFRNTAEFLREADIAVANLESPFLNGRTTPDNSMIFRADPEAVEGLKFAGLDVLSLANNHAMNYKASGLMRTINVLKQVGLAYAGAGENQDAAHTPAILEVRGKKVAFYAYNDPNIPPGYHGEATYNAPGIAKMDISAMQNDVRNALKVYDFAVVSMHAGREYAKEPTQFQKDFARAAIDAGASVVIGHHSHVIQPVEYYKDGVIFYSLGNFIFDQHFSQDVKTGLVAKIFLEKGEKPGVELYPVRIENTQPRFLEGEARDAVLRRLESE